MAFKYMNPGYGELIYPGFYKTIENNFILNPHCGIACRCMVQSNDGVAIIPEDYYVPQIDMPQVFSTDFYAKFNLFCTDTESYDGLTNALFCIHTGSNYSEKIYGRRDELCFSYPIGLRLQPADPIILTCGRADIQTDFSIYRNNLYTIWFHIHTDGTIANSYAELEIAGRLPKTTYYFDRTPDTFSSVPAVFVRAEYVSKVRDVYISDLIISDEEISINEHVAVLPIAETSTDMVRGEAIFGGSGIYTAHEEGKTLLQTPTLSSLMDVYGSDLKVTGIAVAGNPAYRTGTSLTTVTGISKFGDNVVEHNSIDLLPYTSAGIVNGWSLSGVTATDLQTMQFGWKVGT